MPFEAAISTWTFLSMELASSLEAIAEAGFDAVEVWAEGKHLDPRAAGPSEARTARAVCRKLGLRITSLHAPFGEGANIGDFDEQERRRALEVVGEAIRYANLMGAGFVVLHPGTWEGSDDPEAHVEFRGRVLSSLLELSELAEKLGVRLLVENMVPTGRRFRFGAEVEDLLWLCERVPGLEVCFDPGHANIGGGSPASWLEALGRRVRSLHLNDNDGEADLHLVPGRGGIDWASFKGALEFIGYEGPLLFEVHGGEDPLETAREALRWLRGWRG